MEAGGEQIFYDLVDLLLFNSESIMDWGEGVLGFSYNCFIYDKSSPLSWDKNTNIIRD